jgi:hypothetical protein
VECRAEWEDHLPDLLPSEHQRRRSGAEDGLGEKVLSTDPVVEERKAIGAYIEKVIEQAASQPHPVGYQLSRITVLTAYLKRGESCQDAEDFLRRVDARWTSPSQAPTDEKGPQSSQDDGTR